MRRKIEDVREYFVNPKEPESAQDLAQLGAQAIETMAEIYAKRGNLTTKSESDSDLEEVVRELLAREATTRIFDDRFMGQIHPQGNKVGILANLIAAYMNTNTIVKEVSSAEHQMETEATRWLMEMFGYDPETGSGNITVDGTTANIAALWAARESALKRRRQLGLGYPQHKFLILTNEMGHYSIQKAAKLMGMGVISLPRDHFKTDINATEELLARMGKDVVTSRVAAIVALAGETETGLVDDLEGLADIAQHYGIHLHADAAYGGPFILSRNGHLFTGIDQADSITIDPHKMLYTPYEAGAVLFRDRRVHALIENHARYLDHSGSGLLGDPERRNFGLSARLEGSLGSGGVMATWATMRLLGYEGIATILDHTLELVNHAYLLSSHSDVLEPLHKPEINTLLIGLRGEIKMDDLNQTGQQKVRQLNATKPAFSRQPESEPHCARNLLVELVQAELDAEGYYVSYNGEVDQGKAAFRVVPTHPYTECSDVEEVIYRLDHKVSQYLNRNHHE